MIVQLSVHTFIHSVHSSRGCVCVCVWGGGGGGGEACTKFMTESVDSWAAAPLTESMDS